MNRMVRWWSAGIIVALVLAGCGSSRTAAKTSGPSRVDQSTMAHTVTALSLNDITMTRSQEGWGLAPGKVVVTHTGGRTWHNVTPRGFPTASARLLSLGSLAAAFPTTHNGVIAQERASTIRVWRTTDGGTHWQMTTWKASKSIQQHYFLEGSLLLKFRNADDGLLMLTAPGNAGSSSDAILSTTDGGRHWNVIHNTQKISATYLGPSPTTALGDISGGLSLSSRGWGLASVNTVITGRAWALTTTNSGLSWTSRTLPLPTGAVYDSVNEGGAQAGPGPESGWVWLALYNNHTNKEHWFVEHTTDGGAQWTRIPWNQGTSHASTLGGVFLWPQPQGVLVCAAPTTQGTEIWRWSSRNETWQRVTHLPFDHVASLSFLSNGDGWIVGNTGVYRTTNGGRTWKALSPHLR